MAKKTLSGSICIPANGTFGDGAAHTTSPDLIIPRGLYLFQWAEASQVITIVNECSSGDLTYPAGSLGGSVALFIDNNHFRVDVPGILTRIPASTADVIRDDFVKKSDRGGPSSAILDPGPGPVTSVIKTAASGSLA